MMIASSPFAALPSASPATAATAVGEPGVPTFTLNLQAATPTPSNTTVGAPLLAAPVVGDAGLIVQAPAALVAATVPLADVTTIPAMSIPVGKIQTAAIADVPVPVDAGAALAAAPPLDLASPVPAAVVVSKAAPKADQEPASPIGSSPVAAAPKAVETELAAATAEAAPLPDAVSEIPKPTKPVTAAEPALVLEKPVEAQASTRPARGDKDAPKKLTNAVAQPEAPAIAAPAPAPAQIPADAVSAAATAIVPGPVSPAPAKRSAEPEQAASNDEAVVDLGQTIAPAPVVHQAAAPKAEAELASFDPASSPKVETHRPLAANDTAMASTQPISVEPRGGQPVDANGFGAAVDGASARGDDAVQPQGLPTPLLGQSVPAAGSRPLSAQHIYPGHTPPGTVSAQPGRIGKEMGVEIARRMSAGQEEMLIRLNPQEMGRIEVRLRFDDSGAVRAVLASESPAALEMLRRDSGDLARSLADAGVRSDAQSFKFDRSGNDSAWQRGQGGGSGHGQQGRDDGSQNYGSATDDEPDPASYRQLRGSGQVNLIA